MQKIIATCGIATFTMEVDDDLDTDDIEDTVGDMLDQVFSTGTADWPATVSFAWDRPFGHPAVDIEVDGKLI